MAKYYQPTSDFLKKIIKERIAVDNSEQGKKNLAELIELTRDIDRANRDWATMLLAQQDINSGEVREALLRAASDEDEYVRGEAILGLAQRHAGVALNLIREALQGDTVSLPILEAALLVAHPSLVADLRSFTLGEDPLAKLARDALAACENAE